MLNLQVTLPAKTETSYPILIDSGLLKNASLWNVDLSNYKHIIIITDTTVGNLYADILKRAIGLIHNNCVKVLEIEPGEESKTAKTKEWLESEMLQCQLSRDTLCVALGGGVVGDITGFVCATYKRGIDYIQVPTTLLSMVDSSVGGKTAINTSYGKNLIGAFWQPKAVIIDLNCLESLPITHLTAGLVEAIKIFLTSNAVMFDYVKNHVAEILDGNKTVLQYIIAEAVKLKASVVERDEREENLRMILNFGHTVGHGLEFVTNYELLHGYAVAFGIIIEAKIAVATGKLAEGVVEEITNLFMRLGIIDIINKTIINQLKHQSVSQLVSAISTALIHDKKNKNGNVRCVLLKQIGAVSVGGNVDGDVGGNVDINADGHIDVSMNNYDVVIAKPIPMEIINQILFEYLECI